MTTIIKLNDGVEVAVSNGYYTAPPPLAPVTKARSVDINSLSAAVAAAFEKLPDEFSLKRETLNFAVTTGPVNAYLISLAYPPLTYVDGMLVVARFHAANTGPATIKVNTLGAVKVALTNGEHVSAGDLQGVIELRYNAAQLAFNVAPNSFNAAKSLADSIEITEAARAATVAAAAAAALSQAAANASALASAHSAAQSSAVSGIPSLINHGGHAMRVGQDEESIEWGPETARSLAYMANNII